MPAIMGCPHCNAKMTTGGKKNPIICDICERDFNIITISVPMRLEMNDLISKNLNSFSESYYKAGTYFLESLEKRFKDLQKRKGWRILKKGTENELNCTGCGKIIGKKVKSFIEINNKPCCGSCGTLDIFGKVGKAQIYPKSSQGYEDLQKKLGIHMPLKTFFSQAYEDASSFFQRWLSNNWGTLIRRAPLEEELKACKQKALDYKDFNEPNEITRIRDNWRKVLTPMSPLWFFFLYYKGRILSKSQNRKNRRSRIKEMGKVTDMAYKVAQPICTGCENLKQYDWGWECALDSKLGMRKEKTGTHAIAKLSRMPKFPQNKTTIFKEFYSIDPEKGLLQLNFWGKEECAVVKITNMPQLIQRYGAKNLQDNKRYPSLFRSKREKINLFHAQGHQMPAHHLTKMREMIENPYYMLYPVSQSVLINKGEWKHIVVYGPTETCVLSILGEKRKVHFFNHGQIISFKEYFSSQRKKAQKKKAKKKEEGKKSGTGPKKFSYFDIPRDKEQRKIKAILHQETSEIQKYLREMPGKTIILNMKKKKMWRGVSDKNEINAKLTSLADSGFRALLFYKLEKTGFIVEEHLFYLAEKKVIDKEEEENEENSEDGKDNNEKKESKKDLKENKTGLAICPFCQSEIGGIWQDLIILQWQKNLHCFACNKQCNALLAIALNFFQKKEEGRKK